MRGLKLAIMRAFPMGVFLALGFMIHPGVALADDWNGRGDDYGYFSNVYAAGYGASGCPYSMRGANDCKGSDNHQNFVLPPDAACGGSPDALPYSCVHNITQLFNLLKSYNASGNPNLHGSSAFIVQTLLGRDGATANLPANGGRNISAADWADLWARLQAEAPYIDWTDSYTSDTRSYAEYVVSGNNGDVAHYTDSLDPQDDPAIIFTDHGSGELYVLFRPCANPGGSLKGLPAANYGVDPAGSVRTTPVLAGATDQLDVTLTKSGAGDSQAPGYLEVDVPAGIDSPCGSCRPAGMVDLSSFGSGSYGFHGSSNIPGHGGPDWYWQTNAMTRDGTWTAHISFTVAASAPDGTITFNICYNPADLAGTTPHCSTAAFRVESIMTPQLQAENGDVEAGGGLCDIAGNFESGTPPASEGDVLAYPNSGSYGEYVVAASGTISNYGSNGAAYGSTNDILGVGNNGAYSQVCRRNIYEIAVDDKAAGTAGPYTTYGSGSYDISGWSGLVYATGNISIHGTVKHLLTIVELGGTLTIDGDINLDNAFVPTSGNDVISLGVIAQNNIEIDPLATNVDAYLFAQGTIDTCDSSAGSCQTPTLTVNGFLMANWIAYSRLGPHDQDGTYVTEKITLNPQIYLNPPQFFSASVDDNQLQGQGEKQPLF